MTNQLSPSPRPFEWTIRKDTLDLSQQPLIMGILNTTPDSFSDGGQFHHLDQALDQAKVMIKQGADIIDIGGESTRPGAEPVSLDKEYERTIPVIETLRAQWDGYISIDTTKSEIAKAAMQAGADIINDISAMEADPLMIEVAAETQASVILMHKQGSPQTMQINPVYNDVIKSILDYFSQRLGALKSAGIAEHNISLDPGIGFGKTLEHNLTILKHLAELKALGRPLTMGLSRKSFIAQAYPDADLTAPASRDPLTATLSAQAYQAGARIHRVHNIPLCRHALLSAQKTSSPMD